MKTFAAIAILGLAAAVASARNIRVPPRDPTVDAFLAEWARTPSSDGSRIVGGSFAAAGQIPFQAQYATRGGSFFCGGAVINPDTVLTAAHCCVVYDPEDTEVIVGDVNRFVAEGTEKRVAVQSALVHPLYMSQTNNDHDVCVLKLADSLDFTADVDSVPLPEAGREFDGVARVSGFGTLESGGRVSARLRYVDVPIVQDCAANSDYFRPEITDDMMCAGAEGVDSCQGDSGGPLVCDDGSVHCGVVSWGNSCAAEGYPGVYAKTSFFVDWIEARM